MNQASNLKGCLGITPISRLAKPKKGSKRVLLSPFAGLEADCKISLCIGKPLLSGNL